jgi:hypothetical protein
MQACRSRFTGKYSVLNFNAEKNIKYREWSSFSSFCESLSSPQLMIPALAATQITIATQVPQAVDLRTGATLPDAHTSSGSVATQTPTQTPAVPLTSDPPIAPTKKLCTPPSLAAQGCISKRLPSGTSRGQVPATQLAKRRKVVGFSAPASAVDVSSSVSSSRHGSTFSSAVPVNVPGHRISPVPVSCFPALSPEQAGGRRLVRTQTRGTSGKRFEPPKIMRPAPATKEATSGNVEHTQITSRLHGEGARTGAQLNTRHRYLDVLPPMVPPALSPITLPPSLSERKLVQRWAVILSGLSEKERFRCFFVSKLIRYAGKSRLPRSLDSMHTEPRQSTHRPTISSAKTSLGSVYPLCCNRLANLPLL